MKKIFLILTMAGMLFATPATTAQLCMPNFSDEDSYQWDMAGGTDNRFWVDTEDLSIGEYITAIEGIATCAHSGNAKELTFATNPMSNTSSQTNRQCWCKIVFPAVSGWKLARTFSSGSECHMDCADYCGWHFYDNDSAPANQWFN